MLSLFRNGTYVDAYITNFCISMLSLFPSLSVPDPPSTIVGVLEKVGKSISTSSVQFVVRRESVLDDAIRTVQRPNFSVLNRVVVRFFTYLCVYCII